MPMISSITPFWKASPARRCWRPDCSRIFPPRPSPNSGTFNAPAAIPDGTVRDLTGLLWCSIDNDNSLDLDQLTVAQAMPDGKIKILVAVADVDSLVKKGSALDDHAKTNTTSIYTAARIFPMLPEKLSTGLTSLNSDADRAAMVVEMTRGGGRIDAGFRHLPGARPQPRQACL